MAVVKKLAQQQDLLNTPVLKLVLEPLSSDPAGRPDGAVYYNTVDDQPRVLRNGVWGDFGTNLTAADILSALLTVDGAGSALDADLLDGQHGSHYLDRANQTGTQTASTISDFAAAVNALIANVVDGAPGALDTLNELAAALGDDANFAGTVTTALGTKAVVQLSAAFGDGSATSFSVANPAGRVPVLAQLVDASTGRHSDYEAEIVQGAANFTVEFVGYTPTAGQFKLMVVG